MIRFIRRNLALKLVSLGLAYLAWAYVVSRSPGIRYINVPVEVVPPEGILVINYDPREVRVRLEGDAPALNRVNEQNVYALVRLDPGVRPGNQRLTVQDRELTGVPSGITREVITPNVNATLERQVTKLVKVRARFASDPADGYRIARVLIEPPTVSASGPEALMRQIDSVVTEPIDATSRERSFTAQPGLLRPDALVALEPDIVSATVIVEEMPQPLDLELPIESDDLSLVPAEERVRVRLEGPPSLLARVRGQIRAVVDTSSVGGRGGVAPLVVRLGDLPPDDLRRIRIVQLDPPRVRVRRVAQPAN